MPRLLFLRLLLCLEMYMNPSCLHDTNVDVYSDWRGNPDGTFDIQYLNRG